MQGKARQGTHSRQQALASRDSATRGKRPPRGRSGDPLRFIGGGENAKFTSARVQAARGVSMNMLPVISCTASNATVTARRGHRVRLQFATRIEIDPTGALTM